MAENEKRVADLIAALRPFVAAYQRHSDPIGDSDLYDEQPRSVDVTLGDLRRAERVLGGAALVYPPAYVSAQLIIAAPALLAALKAMQIEYVDVLWPGEVRDMAEAAIAKAEGESC